MERLALAVGLHAMVVLGSAAGCSTNGSKPGPEDAAAMVPDSQSDALPEDSGPYACTDARVLLVKASDYDQSCVENIDCVLVAEGNACTPCAFDCAYGAAINAGALAKYRLDVAGTPATGAEFNGQTCISGCGAAFAPCCVAGKCQTSTSGQCPSPSVDAGGAVADGGDAAVDGADDAHDAPADAAADAAQSAGAADAGAG